MDLPPIVGILEEIVSKELYAKLFQSGKSSNGMSNMAK